ncbi:hypothetical protein [Brunnivagina elsteri]|uniref:Uncharacterized protein n=1 Tax=Brunnivagina elsteri CCALA 953 TaxID=987040 RepID=A0A2A2TK76_9CYAN|nr:hypothetical protein [Calothrix elsteri]PAX56153.1 hypothetical protein CK510_10465 [Calothrix elsteri CCALA 953]
MKIIIQTIVFATSLTLFSPAITPSIATTSAQKRTNFNLIRDSKGNITEIKNLTIENQRYNVKFIYGSFREIYNSNIAPTFWQKPEAATKAIDIINTALNSRKSTSPKLGVIPTKYESVKFAGSGNSFIIPVASDRTVREYGHQRTENTYINGVLSSFENQKKTWIKDSFVEFSLTPDTTFTYVQLNPINSVNNLNIPEKRK